MTSPVPYVALVAKVEIAFVANPYSTTLVWTDVTSRVAKFKTTTGRNYETGKNESSVIGVDLRNNDGAFNPLNTSSPYYPYVLPFRPIRVTATVTGSATVYPIWYGFVQSWPQSVKDFASQYEMVSLTGVDAFKAILGFVPGDPYDIKVRKDYGAYVAPGVNSSLWDFYAFDELVAPFVSENIPIRNPLTLATGSAAVAKGGLAPTRSSLLFNGTQGLYNGSAAAGYMSELWVNFTSTTPAQGTAQFIAAAEVVTSGTLGSVSDVYFSGPPGKRLLTIDSPSLAFPHGCLAIVNNYANIMPSDNSASFETSVSDWAAETPSNMTISASSANPAVGANAMRAAINFTSSSTATLSQSTRSAVTPGYLYSFSFSMSVSSTVSTGTTLQARVRFYNSSGALLSTTGNLIASPPLSVAYFQVQSGAVTAPSLAVTASIVISVVATSFSGTADFDAFMFAGSATRAPTNNVAYIAPSLGATSVFVTQLCHDQYSVDQYFLPVPTSGVWHHYAWAPQYGGSTTSLFVADGVPQTITSLQGIEVFDGTAGAVLPMVYLGGLGQNGNLLPGAGFTGEIAGYWNMAPAQGLNNVSTLYAAQHYNYGTSSNGGARPHDFTSEVTSQRITDVLTAIGIPSTMYQLEAGLTTMPASGNVSGVSATELLNQAADAELGNVFIDRNGYVTFHNRNHRNSPVNVAIFGGDGNIPYENNLVVGFDDVYISNDIQITQGSASPSFVFETQDVNSQNVYGVRTRQMTILTTSQTDVQGMAATLLGRYKQPVPRLATLSIELRSKPQYVPAVWVLKIGDLITVNHKPLGGTNYSLQVFIDGVSHTVDERGWVTTLNTTPFYGNTTY